MKKYVFEVVIREGNDDFWKELENVTGCDEVYELIEAALRNYGIEATTKLINFTNKG